jgi:NAD(P)-dependent dehydrogenase (short-subunit alcohol dehydrogenase family)
MSRFDEKVAFVTGGDERHRPRHGARVRPRGHQRRGRRHRRRRRRGDRPPIEQAGGQALAVTCDVSRSEDVRAALDAAVERFGRLDIAFNNAGIEQAISRLTRSPTMNGTAWSPSTSVACSSP